MADRKLTIRVNAEYDPLNDAVDLIKDLMESNMDTTVKSVMVKIKTTDGLFYRNYMMGCFR